MRKGILTIVLSLALLGFLVACTANQEQSQGGLSASGESFLTEGFSQTNSQWESQALELSSSQGESKPQEPLESVGEQDQPNESPSSSQSDGDGESKEQSGNRDQETVSSNGIELPIINF